MTAVIIDTNVVIRITDATQAGHSDAVAAYTEVVDRGFEPVAPDVLLYEAGNFYRRAGGAAPARGFLEALQLCEFRQLTLESAVRACSLASVARIGYADASYVALAEAESALVWTDDHDMLRKFPQRAVATADLVERLG